MCYFWCPSAFSRFFFCTRANVKQRICLAFFLSSPSSLLLTWRTLLTFDAHCKDLSKSCSKTSALVSILCYFWCPNMFSRFFFYTREQMLRNGSIVFSKSETHKHGSVLSFVYILFYIEKSSTFQYKSVHFWCKEEIILSRVCLFQILKKQWTGFFFFLRPYLFFLTWRTLPTFDAHCKDLSKLCSKTRALITSCITLVSFSVLKFSFWISANVTLFFFYLVPSLLLGEFCQYFMHITQNHLNHTQKIHKKRRKTPKIT